jgi:hypothetical protein
MPFPQENSATILRRAQYYLECRDLDGALNSFYEAEAKGADASSAAAGRWECWMLKGEFERAWKESDLLRISQRQDPHRFWDGLALNGRDVMLRYLHGYGDAIQFLRYLPQLQQITRSLTLQVPPALLPLFCKVPWANAVITWEQQESPWDTQIECMELPYIFRTTLANIPNVLSCWQFDEDTNSKTYLNDKPFKVGLVWNAGEWKPSRSIPITEFKLLMQTRAIAFHNLQGGVAKEEWSLVDKVCSTQTPQLPDGIPSLARAIVSMDLVITVDTLAAHLSGTLGTPVWLLLEPAADWRWMVDRRDSPWYPSMTIFRCGRMEDWGSLTLRVQKQLELLLLDRHPSPK